MGLPASSRILVGNHDYPANKEEDFSFPFLSFSKENLPPTAPQGTLERTNGAHSWARNRPQQPEVDRAVFIDI